MIRPTAPIAVIFDMDGVIIDSNPAIIKAWSRFFDQHHIAVTSEQLKHAVFGRTCRDTLQLLFGKSLDEDQYGPRRIGGSRWNRENTVKHPF